MPHQRFDPQRRVSFCRESNSYKIASDNYDGWIGHNRSLADIASSMEFSELHMEELCLLLLHDHNHDHHHHHQINTSTTHTLTQDNNSSSSSSVSALNESCK